ncbi:MaoC family dehydratase [Piscinibacter sakaiensis]|uniref:MaoC family dehydratase n=1 Tax=Piscinibacter sakaiensis TaxID=1547922 RepID=UPI003AAFC56F
MSTATRAVATGRRQRRGNFFEDFRLGQVIRHGTPRTVGDGDVALYIALTGARQALHSSAPVARELGFRSRPLDDLLLFNLAFGKTVPDISLNAVANLGYAEMRFLEPVYAGDTLRCESVVIGMKENSSRQSGVVWVRSTCYREDDAAVLTWVRWVMVRKADPQARVGEPLVPPLAPMITPDRLIVRGRIASTAALAGWCDATGSDDLWDSYSAGDRIVHPTGMTIEEADHMMATRLYQNNARLHFDALAMRDSHVGARLVYGGHVISVCRALAYDGLENVIGIAAINGGSHVAPTVAGDTLYACTEVLERWRLPGRNDLGALRLRLLGLKNLHPAELPAGAITAADGGPHPNVVLDLDHTVLMPRRLSERGAAGSESARRVARSAVS